MYKIHFLLYLHSAKHFQIALLDGYFLFISYSGYMLLMIAAGQGELSGQVPGRNESQEEPVEVLELKYRVEDAKSELQPHQRQELSRLRHSLPSHTGEYADGEAGCRSSFCHEYHPRY